MKHGCDLRKALLAFVAGTVLMSGQAFAQAGGRQPDRNRATGAPSSAPDKPNILFIMGDDIGWMQPGIYHRGLMVGETPNIDRIGQEGAMFVDYVAMQSCTSGRNAFFTGMYPLRTGMIPPQLPGSPSWLRAGTPAIAKFLHDLGYSTGEFGKNHLGDHAEALPTAHGFEEYWGYLYHLDAMQQVSFPDINKSPTEQTVAPPCKTTPVPGLPEVPGAVDPKNNGLPHAAAPGHLVPLLRRNREEPDLQGRGAVDARSIEDSGRGNLGQGHRLPRSQRSQEDQQAVLRLVQPGAHACHDHAVAEV
jgi:arylsulfatase